MGDPTGGGGSGGNPNNPPSGGTPGTGDGCSGNGPWYTLCGGGEPILEPEFTEENYPGKADGYPYMWWTNQSWLIQNFRFDSNVGIAGAPTEDLTWEEIALIAQHPAEALLIKSNAGTAETETISRFGTNGLNNKSDAFRHTYWLALNTKSIGFSLAVLFQYAHETETPPKFQLEKQMDLHNNAVGMNLYQNGLTNSQLAQLAWNAITSGACWYLKPINYSDPCYWSCSGNSTGTHGISSQTQITPTNQ